MCIIAEKVYLPSGVCKGASDEGYGERSWPGLCVLKASLQDFHLTWVHTNR